jgi:DNA helicase HerA-like ATPase
MSDFVGAITQAYAVEGAAVDLGRGVHEGAVHPDAAVRVPLAMMNRHGLVAGATGTGKTKTLQGLAEQLSAFGVPVFVADVKGDLSGLAVPGEGGGPAEKRAADLGIPFAPQGFPVEYLALGGIGDGVPLRATVSDFGPQLLARVLGANETQEQSLGLVFHYADEKGLALVDLSDLRALLTFLSSDEGKAELKGIGGLSGATVGVLLRTLVGLEDGGGTEYFGEPAFDVTDLLRVAEDGRGVISCLELPGVQDKPELFSTALMGLLAELFETLPEAGDLPKPKLVFFFDEAHLLFDGATKAFVDSVEQTVRLIRSKGVGVFFVTQTPKDLPADVLGQLGNRVQHALRAFTPDDAKALKATVSTFPRSEFYDLQELLPAMGIGEAAVTVLSANGVPTPVVHTRMCPPRSRMAPAEDVVARVAASPLAAKYGTRLEGPSAREALQVRVDTARDAAAAAAAQAEADKATAAAAKQAEKAAAAEAKARAREEAAARRQAPAPPRRAPAPPSGGDGGLGDFLQSRQGKQLQKEVVRGVFGMLRKRF